MKVLVIGSGGREHALAWKLAQSARVRRVFVAPGNAGTARDARMTNLPLGAPKPVASRQAPRGGQGNLGAARHFLESDVAELVAFAQAESIALTVVGPEQPLAAGVVDAFRARGLRIVGPTRAAAQLESSKAFSKAFMQRHGIPTAAYATFTDADAAHAHAHVDAAGAPIVVKADGLAAGKGVVVAMTAAEAHEAIDRMLLPAGGQIPAHGDEPPRLVIEEFLQGEEASFIVLCDGRHVLPLASSQDHKRLLDGDQGPNTGGMGAYSPAPVVTPVVHERVMRRIIEPTVAGMAADGVPFTGFLYAGLMIDAQGEPKTLEFNTRLGDPEAQPLLMRLRSDLFEVLSHAADGTLDRVALAWDERAALGVVMAAAGYPQAPRRGDAIRGLPPDSDDAMVFHAGTALDGDRVVVAGGRVLCATALGASVRDAQQRAYHLAGRIDFDGAQWRRDIGRRAVDR